MFVSYAQNFEDVMLARALGTVEAGFYIDVGAQDPEEGSVTKHFYDQGWRGLNFEPSAHYHAQLEAARPRDLNLRCAVGASPGTVTFYEAEGTGLSTIIESVSAGTPGPQVTRSVPLTTLDAACAAYGVGTVHFLKIDVEGAEELVLRGTRLEAVRPWIVVVEATHPNSPEPYYSHWEPLLTERGYRFVYADGLNRFYLAEEHIGLAHHFELPPNYFDDFARAREVRAEDNLAHHMDIIGQIDADRTQLQAVLEEHAARIITLGGQLEEQQREIQRLVDLLDTASRREQETIAHHIRLIEEAATRVAAQHDEILRLQASLAESNDLAATQRDVTTYLRIDLKNAEDRINTIETEAKHLKDRINAFRSEAKSLHVQIAFRDNKIGWLTLDRERFKAAHATIVQSPIWRLTRPLQSKDARAATRARALGQLMPQDRPVLATTSEASQPGELPETASWIQRRLWAA
ncbi:FkbM family methyltransferase [Methylobacterium sp. WL12]|nr:FkbM family methyltransferase [Methylobacterium sp. WL12]